MISRECFGNLAEAILEVGAIQAIKYFSPKERVKATMRRNKGKCKDIEILFTIGKPNYKERKFVKDCIKAKEKFPIRKIILKFHNPKGLKVVK